MYSPPNVLVDSDQQRDSGLNSNRQQSVDCEPGCPSGQAARGGGCAGPMLLASNLCRLESHFPSIEMLDHLALVCRCSENSERALDSSKLAAFRRCNARASWPTRQWRPSHHSLRPTHLEAAKFELWILDFKRRKIAVIGFCLRRRTSSGRASTFFRGCRERRRLICHNCRGGTPWPLLVVRNLHLSRSSSSLHRGCPRRDTPTTGAGETLAFPGSAQKESPGHDGWVTFGDNSSGPWLSDVWTIVNLAGLNERITVGETVQSNVVVFDLGIKRGDF